MRLMMVRHGETEENVEKITQGWLPGKLSEQGKEQVKKLALRLKDEHFDVVYCSDLQRTKDTCAEIMKFHPDTPVHFVEELRERGKGIYEGKPHGEARAYYEEQKEKNPDINGYERKTPGGESWADMHERVVGFYHQMIEKHMNQRVLWVVHGGTKYMVLFKVLDLDAEKAKYIHSDNTSVTIIEVDDDGKHHAKLRNCVAHL